MSDIYVVVADNDQPHKIAGQKWSFDPGGPLVFEQYTRHADLESIKKRAAELSERYGVCRVARLVFVDV